MTEAQKAAASKAMFRALFMACAGLSLQMSAPENVTNLPSAAIGRPALNRAGNEATASAAPGRHDNADGLLSVHLRNPAFYRCLLETHHLRTDFRHATASFHHRESAVRPIAGLIALPLTAGFGSSRSRTQYFYTELHSDKNLESEREDPTVIVNSGPSLICCTS